MGHILCEKNVSQYLEDEPGWDIYSLLFDPLPILAYRNMNDYDDRYTKDDWHSTWSWRLNRNLNEAVEVACLVLSRWKALRHPEPGRQEDLRARLKQQLPRIIARFVNRAWPLRLRRIRDVHPSEEKYVSLIIEMALAVEQVVKLKLDNANNPMLGSKALHFVLPEFFPVWDTAFIKNKCLRNEQLPDLPLEVDKALKTDAAREYATYVHFMVTELNHIPPEDYELVERMCVTRAVGSDLTTSAHEVLAWHYDDLSTTVFEICLLGKHVTEECRAVEK